MSLSQFKSNRTVAAIIAACFISVFAAGSFAATSLTPATEMLAGGRYSDAVDFLMGVINDDSDNGAAWYMLGRSFNRLGLFDRAERALAMAVSVMGDRPEMKRELAIVLQSRGENRKVLEILEGVPADDPEACLIRARALTALGRKGAAKLEAEKAAKDPVLEETARDLTENGLPVVQPKKAAGAEGRRPVMKAARKLVGSVSVSFCHNTNVTLRADDAIQSPAEKSDKAADCYRFEFDGRYEFHVQGHERCSWLLHVDRALFDELATFNQTNFRAGMEIFRKAGDRTRTWLKPSIEIARVASNSYYSRFVLPYTVRHRVSDNSTLEGNIVIRVAQYHNEVLDDEDLDGLSWHVDFGPHLETADKKLSGRFAVTFDRSEAEGASMRNKALGFKLNTLTRLNDRIDLRLDAAWNQSQYENPNVRSQAWPQARRVDSFDSIAARLVYKLDGGQSIDLFYTHSHNNSNIDTFFTYKQEILGLGYTVPF